MTKSQLAGDNVTAGAFENAMRVSYTCTTDSHVQYICTWCTCILPCVLSSFMSFLKASC